MIFTFTEELRLCREGVKCLCTGAHEFLYPLPGQLEWTGHVQNDHGEDSAGQGQPLTADGKQVDSSVSVPRVTSTDLQVHATHYPLNASFVSGRVDGEGRIGGEREVEREIGRRESRGGGREREEREKRGGKGISHANKKTTCKVLTC